MRVAVFFFFISFVLVSTSADTEWKAADLVRPYLLEYMAAIENEFVYDSEGNFVGPTPRWKETERLLTEILMNRSAEGDEAVAYLLFFYTGEHPGSVLICEASRRGDRMLPIIEAYQEALPETGLEPQIDALRGSGILQRRALELIRSGETCRH